MDTALIISNWVGVYVNGIRCHIIYLYWFQNYSLQPQENDKNITGVQIENSEFLVSQYADDSSLVLDDNPQSLEKSLLVLSLFPECFGLKVNLDKTEAIWIGSKHGSEEEYFLQNNITWNHTGRFKRLGIKYDLNSADKTLLNFPDKLQSINKILLKCLMVA